MFTVTEFYIFTFGNLLPSNFLLTLLCPCFFPLVTSHSSFVLLSLICSAFIRHSPMYTFSSLLYFFAQLFLCLSLSLSLSLSTLISWHNLSIIAVINTMEFSRWPHWPSLDIAPGKMTERGRVGVAKHWIIIFI